MLEQGIEGPRGLSGSVPLGLLVLRDVLARLELEVSMSTSNVKG